MRALLLTSLITFSNSASFNLLLKQLSLSKLQIQTTQNTLSRDFYRIFLNYIGNFFFLGAMSISCSLHFAASWINLLINTPHFAHYLNAKLSNWQNHGSQISFSFLVSGNRGKYKVYRNKILHLSRISKRTFYHIYFRQNVCNVKKTWEGINALFSHRKVTTLTY